MSESLDTTKRVSRARRAVLAYASEDASYAARVAENTSPHPNETLLEAAQDLMTDLMHLIRREVEPADDEDGVAEVESRLDMARVHFDEELAEEGINA